MNSVIHTHLNQLLQYGLNHALFTKEHLNDVIERLSKTLKVDDIVLTMDHASHDLDVIMNPILDYAYSTGLLSNNTIDERDAYEALLMDLIMPSPLEIKQHFKNLYLKEPQLATDYLYELSADVNYIKKLRLKQNLEWTYQCQFGKLQMTINLAKPEKDPKDIALAKAHVKPASSDIPLCVICKENEQNYHNARMNLRIVPLQLGHELWHFQYSPYLYYNEHAIILHDEHRPMKIHQKTFEYLLDFVDAFPNYFIGSNADLPIVGGSILNHDHFQAGRHTFPIAQADALLYFKTPDDITLTQLNWPLSTLRLVSKKRDLIMKYATAFLDAWKSYTNPELDIIAYTDLEPHQTLTPILRKKDDIYEMDLIFRNNRTSEMHPLGIFHPHQDVQHIKKENIGLIEAMGLAILPGRLKNELNAILLNLKNQYQHLPPELIIHEDWYQALLHKYDDTVTFEDLLNEVGHKFEKVLIDSGVFKLNQKGIKAMEIWIKSVIKEF